MVAISLVRRVERKPLYSRSRLSAKGVAGCRVAPCSGAVGCTGAAVPAAAALAGGRLAAAAMTTLEALGRALVVPEGRPAGTATATA